ncbi:MAG TPA: NADH-quinone oxidoreductase subunit NuoE [bacterium]|nr:NADH-quinone oxidoreductase subunit NuoE [bacterium]
MQASKEVGITTDEASEFSEEQFKELDAAIKELKDKSGSVIRVLSKAQEIFGYLPREVQFKIAQGLNIPLSEVYGITTFYSFFSIVPRGKHTISTCMGTACYVRGSKEVLEELTKILGIGVGETTPDREFSLESVRCMGACALAPVVRIDDDVYRQVTPKKVHSILKKYSEEAGGEE